MASFQLSRRQLLRGAVGGAIGGLALPTLEAMLNRHGDAYAATNQPLPKRLGVFFFGNGVRLDRWVPAQAGANWRLSAELAPLAERSRIVQFSAWVMPSRHKVAGVLALTRRSLRLWSAALSAPMPDLSRVPPLSSDCAR